MRPELDVDDFDIDLELQKVDLELQKADPAVHIETQTWSLKVSSTGVVSVTFSLALIVIIVWIIVSTRASH